MQEQQKSKIGQLMGVTMEKIREMVDVQTIIGDPIVTGGITVIPVSKVSYGFASGGTDLPAKSNPKELFGGGAGCGVSIQPVAFLVIQDDQVRLMQMADSEDKAGNIIRSIPELIQRLTDMISKKKNKGADIDVESAVDAAMNQKNAE